MSSFHPIHIGASILKVRKSQEGNPLLSHISRAKLEWCPSNELLADFVTKGVGILFLQVSWHRKNPVYIKHQMHGMKNMFKLRVLLLHYNEQESDLGSSASMVLEEMNSLCLTLDFTLVVAMTVQECARYLEYFLEFEGTSDTSIKGQYEREFQPRVAQLLTSVRKVTKADAKTLMNDFTCLKNVVTSNSEELSICQGVGALKAKRMVAAFQAPFLPKTKTS